MTITALPLAGLALVQLQVFKDARGFFMERFRADVFRAHGLPSSFVQENHARSVPRVLRGMHYQTNPAQGKLVGVTHGRVWDVAVDLRHDSPTFGRHHAVELSDENGLLFWIPPGFGHGFCVLGEEPADMVYEMTAHYNPEGDGGVVWNDTDLAVPWPVTNPVLSSRDAALPTFAQFRANPVTDWT